MHLCIVGTSRSGSTLLRELINAHPDVRLFNETHWIPRMFEFFGMQRVNWRRILDVARKTTWDSGRGLLDVNAALFGHDTSVVIERLEARLGSTGNVDIAEFHTALAEICMGSGNLWGDKTPDYGFHMATLQGIWPECRFVHIVRDCAPTARSMSKHRGCQLMISAGYDNWCSLSYDSLYSSYQLRALSLSAFVESWCRRMSRIRDESRRLKANTYLEVCYEDLLDQPATVLAAVGEWAGLTSSETWTERARDIVRNSQDKKPLPLETLLDLPVNDLLLIRELDKAESTGRREYPDSIPRPGSAATNEPGWRRATRDALGELCDAIKGRDGPHAVAARKLLLGSTGTQMPLKDSTLFRSLGEELPALRHPD